MAQENIADYFRGAIVELQKKAGVIGISVTELCTAAEISRQTFHRYRKRVPQAIRNVERMQLELEKRIAAV